MTTKEEPLIYFSKKLISPTKTNIGLGQKGGKIFSQANGPQNGLKLELNNKRNSRKYLNA
jgi:hypothetical protein